MGYRTSRVAALGFAVVLFAISGCQSCSESTTSRGIGGEYDASGEVEGHRPKPSLECTDGDNDGWGTGPGCARADDCDDTEPYINPGAAERCDGQDNDCDGQVDEECAACTDGETRDCSTNQGVCEAGTQECVDGEWQECSGVEPSPEVCNEKDDDCDGEVDENPDQICDDGSQCNGQETCRNGTCEPGEPFDCSYLDEPCQVGECAEKPSHSIDERVTSVCAEKECSKGDWGCYAAERPDGASCEDDNPCTVDGVCNQGTCETSEKDCSHLDGPCTTGVCDPEAGGCKAVPVADGTACDDGSFCTVGDTCQAGTCTGETRDCSGEADQCNKGVCNEEADQCEKEPRADGKSCDDGQYCTTNDTCQDGVCEGGDERKCGAADGSCRTGTCDEEADACTGEPVEDGTACDNGEFCTIGDECVDGTCVEGTDRDCSDAGDQCNKGVCNEDLDACEPEPVSDGTDCSDGEYCTVDDACADGTCEGTARDCSDLADQCNNGVCDESADSCVKEPVENGTSCDDGQFCTDPDVCEDGACVGDGQRDCSDAAGGDPCLDGFCDEDADQCKAEQNGECCDTSIDNDLDGYNQCEDCDDTNGSVYPNAEERCNGIDDDCDGAIDEDFDQDGDGYSVCANDPAEVDCDDTDENVNPGMDELCGEDGTGNGIDDNCNGYVDEGCDPCDSSDNDGDGYSECDGDCDDSDPDTYPGAPELCDGKDNDCNKKTRKNCGVSDVCNHDGDDPPDFSDDPDICKDNMICACRIEGGGRGATCKGDYRCTSFCNSSETGPVGDTCQDDQVCNLILLASANVNGCSVTTDTPGTKLGGAQCGGDGECRSLNCDKICKQGKFDVCKKEFCQDFCGSDEYCADGAVCEPTRVGASNADYALHGRCMPNNARTLGDKAVGETCGADGECDHGYCMTDRDRGDDYCTETCCKDSDCPNDYTCSIRTGEQTDSNYIHIEPDADTCSTDGDCTGGATECYDPDGDGNGECAWRLVETSPLCKKDVDGQGDRVAGQACSSNSDCESNFCERELEVCVQTCCADSDCPTGLTCEYQTPQTTTERATDARVCMNLSTDRVLRPMK